MCSVAVGLRLAFEVAFEEFFALHKECPAIPIGALICGPGASYLMPQCAFNAAGSHPC